MSTEMAVVQDPAVGICPWTPETNGESLEGWAKARLEQYQGSIDQLLAVEGARTVENTLRPFDDAQAELATVGQHASLLDSVHPQKDVRDMAQALTQKVSEIGTLLSLNQEVYHALSAIDATEADAATRHYLERTLLQYRLSGVDRDETTRSRIKELQDKATEISLAFSRNVQEGAKHIIVSNGDLDGLPEDYLKAHPPSEDGTISLSTDFPDMQPLMTYAKQRGSPATHVSGLPHPGVPAEQGTTARIAQDPAGAGDDPRLPELGRSSDCRPDDAVCGEHAELSE